MILFLTQAFFWPLQANRRQNLKNISDFKLCTQTWFAGLHVFPGLLKLSNLGCGWLEWLDVCTIYLAQDCEEQLLFGRVEILQANCLYLKVRNVQNHYRIFMNNIACIQHRFENMN